MNNKQFINKEILNKNNEKGVVTHFDDEHIKVRYLDKETTYNVEVAFTNKYLSFVDSKINSFIEEKLHKNEQEKIKKELTAEKNRQISIRRYKTVIEQYKKISQKNRLLQFLFGDDFIYPPYKQFKKKYRYLL